MRTRTVTVREGEFLGPIDWSYDFMYHFHNYCCSEEQKRQYCDRAKDILRMAEELYILGEPLCVQVNEWWHDVYNVGMYDGWPFWKPTPALLTHGTLGPETHFFSDLRQVRHGHLKRIHI